MTSDAQSLETLRDAVKQEKRAALRVAKAVERCRQCGWSWGDIASAIGTSRQNAWQRWARLDRVRDGAKGA